MPVRNDPELVAFDAAAALDRVLEQAGEDLLVCVEFTDEAFNTLYAAGAIVELYGGPDRMQAAFEDIHSYVHIDLTERQLFEDAVDAGDVRAFVTYMDESTMVRVLGGKSGLFVTLTPHAAVTPVVEAVEAELAV